MVEFSSILSARPMTAFNKSVVLLLDKKLENVK